MAGLAKDANTETDAGALSTLKSQLLACGYLVGFLQQDPEAWFQSGSDSVDAAKVEALIEERNAARAGKDFARADAIRDELSAMGVSIEDGPEGTTWKLAD